MTCSAAAGTPARATAATAADPAPVPAARTVPPLRGLFVSLSVHVIRLPNLTLRITEFDADTLFIFVVLYLLIRL